MQRLKCALVVGTLGRCGRLLLLIGGAANLVRLLVGEEVALGGEHVLVLACLVQVVLLVEYLLVAEKSHFNVHITIE